MITTIGLDGDDTLWENEKRFVAFRQEFRNVLLPYHSETWINERLMMTERKNLNLFGYGAKELVISMIETAIELTEGRITGAEIQTIIDAMRRMLATPMVVLDGVRESLAMLTAAYRLVLITKGDLFEQEIKIARSGLANMFTAIEIVSEKSPEAYASILRKHAITPSQFLMVGNSIRSDVLPVIKIGGHAVHIPYDVTWGHEKAVGDVEHEAFCVLDSIAELPSYVDRLRISP